MRIDYSNDALDDLEAIDAYYRRTASAEVASGMIARITATLVSRAKAGWGSAAVYDKKRKVYITPVLGTSYLIIYELAGDIMEIVAVQFPPHRR